MHMLGRWPQPAQLLQSAQRADAHRRFCGNAIGKSRHGGSVHPCFLAPVACRRSCWVSGQR